MATLQWYTIKYALVGVRDFELQEAIDELRRVLESFPHLENVIVEGDGNSIIVQVDSEDLDNLEIEDVGRRSSEEILEVLPAVLMNPTGVKVEVLETKTRKSN